MDILQAIRYVGTPLALLAFVVGVGAILYLKRLRTREREINAAPKSERAAVIATLKDTYLIRDDTLSPGQKFELMRSVLRIRAATSRNVALLSAFFGLVFSVLAAYAFYVFSLPTNNSYVIVSNANTPTPTNEMRSSFLYAPALPAEGNWDVTMACLDGSRVNETGARFVGGRYARGFLTEDGRKGITELAMGNNSDSTINVTGFIVFGDVGVYTVAATGTLSGNRYSGKGTFGSSQDCGLSVKQAN